MKSSSLKIAKELGFLIEDLRLYRDALIHDWYLAPQYQEKLSIFILRETTPEEFFFHFIDGELIVHGKLYSVTWCNSPEAVRKSAVLLLSLRFCKYLERGYVLVKVLMGNSEYDKLEY